MEPAEQLSSPRPVLLSFHPEVAHGVARGDVPWEFRKRRSGHERGTRVLMYASGKVRAVVGAYTAGTVFEYDTFAALRDGIHASETARFGTDEIDYRMLASDIYPALPRGWAFDILEPCAFDPPLELGRTPEGKKVKGPQGFQYLDLGNADHQRLWRSVRAALQDDAPLPSA